MACAADKLTGSRSTYVSKAKVTRVVKPLIVADNERILRNLKKRPEDLHKLEPRQFEGVLADLLQDMGYEVTLTQQTRDDGKDIIASNTAGSDQVGGPALAKYFSHPQAPHNGAENHSPGNSVATYSTLHLTETRLWPLWQFVNPEERSFVSISEGTARWRALVAHCRFSRHIAVDREASGPGRLVSPRS
jgi:hypothetical protein